MKKLLTLRSSLLLVAVLLTSCTAESIAQEEVKQELPLKEENTFTVIWSSNQQSPYVEFNKHIFINCDEHTTVTEIHRENKFEITLEDNQVFDIHIKRESSVKNPELYLSIYKGDELQYEKEIDANAFVLMSFVDGNGNIGQVKY